MPYPIISQIQISCNLYTTISNITPYFKLLSHIRINDYAPALIFLNLNTEKNIFVPNEQPTLKSFPLVSQIDASLNYYDKFYKHFTYTHQCTFTQRLYLNINSSNNQSYPTSILKRY